MSELFRNVQRNSILLGSDSPFQDWWHNCLLSSLSAIVLSHSGKEMSNYAQRINDATNKRTNELPGVREGEGVAEHAHPGAGFAGEEVGWAVGEL